MRALICTPLEADGFANGFSTRAGGVSPMPQGALNLAGFNEDEAANIYENRRRFLKLFAGDWRLTGCWQIHGSSVRVVRDPSDVRSDEERCDGLSTNVTRVLLGIKTADCVPVLLADARTGACAAVHAGWRGTVESIVVRALELMNEEYGTRAEDLRASIGPAALVCCYEVGAEVIEAFRARFQDAESLLTPTREGHARIDLHLANFNQLIAKGVHAECIHLAPFCTMCRNDLFFSYRREKRLHGRVGRLMSVVGKT